MKGETHMASIGRSKHLKCIIPGCGKQRPYWADHCKAHREAVTQCGSYQGEGSNRSTKTSSPDVCEETK